MPKPKPEEPVVGSPVSETKAAETETKQPELETKAPEPASAPAETPAKAAEELREEGINATAEADGIHVDLPPEEPQGAVKRPPGGTVTCPKCGSEAVGMAGGKRNCNQCGNRF